MTGAYFVSEPDGLRPGPEARSPWSPDMLHGRLLGGLAARAVEAANDEPSMRVVRLTVDMFRAPPMTPIVTTVTTARAGGRVRAVDVSMRCADVEVARARALLLKTGDHPSGTVWQSPNWDAPPPEAVPTFESEAPGGWELRLMSEGGFWSDARKRLWCRDTWALVAGEEPSPVVRAALAADLPNPMANSGAGGLKFINADLTLFLARPPVCEWIGLEVADHVGADGVAIGSCTLYDTGGPIGSSTVCAVTTAATIGE